MCIVKNEYVNKEHLYLLKLFPTTEKVPDLENLFYSKGRTVSTRGGGSRRVDGISPAKEAKEERRRIKFWGSKNNNNNGTFRFIDTAYKLSLSKLRFNEGWWTTVRALLVHRCCKIYEILMNAFVLSRPWLLMRFGGFLKRIPTELGNGNWDRRIRTLFVKGRWAF